MSGGHFDYKQYAVREIADRIEHDIAWALAPKPALVHDDYWSIFEMDAYRGYHMYPSYSRHFATYEEAEKYLLSTGNIVKAEQRYVDLKLFSDPTQFQSTNQYMERVPNDEQIPVLYEIHHVVSDHYPYDEDVLELEDSTIEAMKEAYRILRLAEIYAKRIDWMMSGDDGEETMHKRLKVELEEFEKEYASKDWTILEEDE